ncbi:MAG: Uncharacterized protein Athens101428_370 [Candidatus Berkelbacteria bacterium Athens1014_28]|uniref:Uncharacterized protein n=1 Tax=Candidatus Berkelbacteria bacterium Athens1014_28 TaxID=2017145 RepID=A0A554LN15_9BACT|nr:MAG: Uncharacterized protein Athens101428_370 [Candidatus Berkelbacteria bacterium Athens1014_28]
MRNDIWLENRLEYIFRKYFSDIPATNQIHIKFGRNSYRQLGCIKSQSKSQIKQIRENSPTIIVISGFFRDEEIPNFVIDGA